MLDLIERLLFPKNLYCACCGDFIDATRIHAICDSCREKINWINDNPYASSMDAFAFDELFACCIYGSYPKKIISKLKSGDAYLAEPIALMLCDWLEAEWKGSIADIDYVCFVPCSEEKLKKRGYNQGRLLAEFTAKRCRLSLLDALEKTAETGSMRSAGKFERNIMLADAFRAKRDWTCTDYSSGKKRCLKLSKRRLDGKTVLLIDDVVTTGNTANEVSRTLKELGAERVCILAFACGTNITTYDS